MTDARICEHCDATYTRGTENKARYLRRRFCSPACSVATNRDRDRSHEDAALIENVLFLLDPTAPRLALQDVAQRVGYQRPDSLTRRLHRAGRSDLVRRLYRDEAAA